MSKITTKECAARGCNHLLMMSETGRAYRICEVTRRIPGNMARCPLDPKEVEGV